MSYQIKETSHIYNYQAENQLIEKSTYNQGSKKGILARLELTGKSNLLNDSFFEESIYKFYVTEKQSTPDSMTKEFTDELLQQVRKQRLIFSIYLAFITISQFYIGIKMSQQEQQNNMYTPIAIILLISWLLSIVSYIFYIQGCQKYKINYILASYAILGLDFLIGIAKSVLFTINFSNDEQQMQDQQNEDQKSDLLIKLSLWIQIFFYTLLPVTLWFIFKLKTIKLNMTYLLSMVKAI